MSKELVKWQLPESEAGRKIDNALVRLGNDRAPQKPGRPAEIETRRTQRALDGEVIDVLRTCAVHDKVYVARYVSDASGRFQYSQTIKVTEALFLGQYADSQVLFNSFDAAEECCPWCGSSGFGSVRCGKCGKEICFGKTTARYFRCRSSCGSQGTLGPPVRRQEAGVTPSLRRGSYSTE